MKAKIILKWILWVIITYLLLAFLTWELNPENWHGFVRGVGIMAVVIEYGIISTD